MALATSAPADVDAGDWFKALLRAIEFFAELLKGLLWVLAGIGLAAAIFLVLRYRQRRPIARAAAAAPEFLFAPDLGAALPADVAAAAQAALARGDSVEALSLLYRGALVALMHAHAIEFASADTENDCLRRVAGRVPEAIDRCFAELVEAWRLAAYGRLSLPVASVEALLAGWEACFGKRAPRP